MSRDRDLWRDTLTFDLPDQRTPSGVTIGTLLSLSSMTPFLSLHPPHLRSGLKTSISRSPGSLVSSPLFLDWSLALSPPETHTHTRFSAENTCHYTPHGTACRERDSYTCHSTRLGSLCVCGQGCQTVPACIAVLQGDHSSEACSTERTLGRQKNYQHKAVSTFMFSLITRTHVYQYS